jgi:hypothetical protein
MAASAVYVRASSPAAMLANWARQGIDSFIAAQRILLDLTAQEYALGMGMVKERVRIPNLLPIGSMVEMAGQGVTAFIGVQKILLELAAGETVVAITALKKGLGLSPATGAMADIVQTGVGTFISMQQQFLVAAENETKAAIEAYRAGKPMMTGSHAAELARHAVEAFVETQKTFLDAVAEQVNMATQPPKDARKTIEARQPKELTSLARAGVDKFIDAQRKLLHLAVDQFEAEDKPRPRKREPHTSVAELTQKSIQNFTTAQKSLLDLAIKPIRDSAQTVAHDRPATKRPAPRRRAKKASAGASK